MSIFKKQIKFISAICPECKGNLQLDPKLETAICSKCGAQIIVQNAQKPKKQGKLEIVFDFVERQQARRKQEKEEKQQKEDAERERVEAKRAERNRKISENLKENWWKYLLIGIGICLLCSVLAKALG